MIGMQSSDVIVDDPKYLYLVDYKAGPFPSDTNHRSSLIT